MKKPDGAVAVAAAASQPASAGMAAGKQGEVRLSGVRISPGLGIGRALIFYDLLDEQGRSQSISPNEVTRELGRIQDAFGQAREELAQSAYRVEAQFSKNLADILRTHEKLLESLLQSQEFERELRGSLVSAEIAVRRVFRRWQDRFGSLENETFRQRADDITDLGRSILRYLERAGDQRFGDLPADSVLVLARLLPSDVVSLSRRKVAAIIVEALGSAAHAALLAREKAIPTVAGFPGLLDRIHNGDEVLVDGDRGEIIIAPTPPSRSEFQQRFAAYHQMLDTCKGDCHCPAITRDGSAVAVEANTGAYEDVELVVENGADGVGLFRLEQLYLARRYPPTEDELFKELRTIAAPLRGKPLTMRLLDAGGDKLLASFPAPAEANPLLGIRGVRLLLEFPQLLRVQLLALLRLAQEQEIRLLVPMVTLEEDASAVRTMLEALWAELSPTMRPPLGAMIETPAAALNVPAIVRHVDFLCVGTNDLTQYTLAAARDDPAVSRYYLDAHVSVLRLIGMIVADAGPAPVSVCGELAGREEVIPQLLALGVRSLSVAPLLVPRIKQCIRSVDIRLRRT